MPTIPYASALIVGAGPGLGASLARTFTRDAGMRVIVAARGRGKLEAIARETGAGVMTCDSTDADAVAALFDAATEQLGGAPEVVVYNASQRVRGPLSKSTRWPWPAPSRSRRTASTAASGSHRANITPPKDASKWAELVRSFVQHCVDRYGVDEVREWFFEVWNEPNLMSFWKGTQDDYFHFYRVTATAVKQVDAAFKVGGAATAKNEWIAEFLAYGQRHNAPVDFVSTHQYPSDALGSATDDTEGQLAASRRGILHEQVQDTYRQAAGKPVYYAEWNASSNPRDACHDESYAAAFLVKSVLEANGLVRAYSFWTFSDIFEENYFPSQPFHGGFGLLNLCGVPKPVYRAFELLHALGREQLLVDGIHPTVDAWAVRKGDSLTLLLANHALPRRAIEAEQVTFFIDGSPAPQSVSIQRIDDTHANPLGAWQAMGKPQYLDAVQVEQLESTSRLRGEPQKWTHAKERPQLHFALPVNGVAAIIVKYPAGAASDKR